MPTCKFWAKGHCRFGDRCWYDHPSGGQHYQQDYYEDEYDYRNEHRNYRQQNYNPNNRFAVLTPEERNVKVTFNNSNNKNNITNKQKHQNVHHKRTHHDVHDFTETILNELAVWENGKQWPYTAFGVLVNDKIFALPGFYDLSMEELRWKAYKAEQTGMQAQYSSEISRLSNDILMKRANLKNMQNSDLIQLITRLSNQDGPPEQSNSQFFKPGTFSPIHSNSKSSAGNFSFRLENNDAQTKPSPSSFSFKLDHHVPEANSAASDFKFNFGGNDSSSTNFANSSPFGSSPGFSTASQPSLFGSSSNFANSSPFDSAPGFSTVSQPSLFGGSSNFTSTPVTATNVFQNTDGQNFNMSTISNQPVKLDTSATECSPYSKLSELDENQIKQFKAPKFTAGLIPSLPPTVELCR